MKYKNERIKNKRIKNKIIKKELIPGILSLVLNSNGQEIRMLFGGQCDDNWAVTLPEKSKNQPQSRQQCCRYGRLLS